MADDLERVDKLAAELRKAAYPGARSWTAADESVRIVWCRVAELTLSHIEREVDKALREATAKAHERGQHAAAKMLRDMRFERDRRHG